MNLRVELLIEERSAGRYRARWSGAEPGEIGKLSVFAGPTPEAIDFSKPVAEVESKDVEVELDERVSEWPRPAFAIRFEDGTISITRSRNVSIDAVKNFRDLGGYRVSGFGSEARRVKWGRIYRSGHFNGLEDPGRLRLLELDLGRVMDFRVDRERERRPNRFAESHALEILELSVDPGSFAAFRETITEGTINEDTVVNSMCEINRSLVRDHAPTYRALLDALLDDPEPVNVIQCASGKDRTGVGAALILFALGADRETVLYDYMLTNLFFEADEQFEKVLQDFGGFDQAIITPEMLRPMMEVRLEYLGSALDEIDRNFGGPDAYLESKLGFDSSRRAALQEHYTEVDDPA